MSRLVLRWVEARRTARFGRPCLGDHALAEVQARVVVGAERLDHRRWSLSLLAALWGNSAINQLADRAGQHRRLAVLAGSVAVPVAVIAAHGAPATAPAWRQPHFGGLMAVAVCLMWLAVDLARTGSLASGDQRPHLSTMGLAGSTVLIAAGRVGPPSGQLTPAAYAGLALCTAALIVLTISDVRPNLLVDLVGRILSIAGAAGFALAALDWLVSGRGTGAAVVSMVVIGAALAGYGVTEGRTVSSRIRLMTALLR